MGSNYITDKRSKFVVCARVGGANTTPLFLAVHFAKQNTKFGGGESPSSRTLRVHYGARSEGGAGIHFPPTPFSARPAPSGLVSAAPAARHQSGFRSKKVRTAFSNCDQSKLNDFSEREDCSLAPPSAWLETLLFGD
jgi:hypothetical protein